MFREGALLKGWFEVLLTLTLRSFLYIGEVNCLALVSQPTPHPIPVDYDHAVLSWQGSGSKDIVLTLHEKWDFCQYVAL